MRNSGVWLATCYSEFGNYGYHFSELAWTSDDVREAVSPRVPPTVHAYAGGPRISALPDELLLLIFSHMTLSENINILQKVCTRWKNLAQDAKLWRHMEYVISEDTTEESAIATFRAAPQLRSVVVEKAVSSAVFQALSENCHNLTVLDAWYNEINAKVAKNLFDSCKKISTLRTLDRGLTVGHRFLKAVAQLSQLQMLHLHASCNLDLSVCLRFLSDKCPLLHTLDIGHLHYRMADMEYFIRSRKRPLLHMYVRWTSTEGRCIVPVLRWHANMLEYLYLSYYDIDEVEAMVAFHVLGKLHNLRVLCLTAGHKPVSHLIALPFRSGNLSKLEYLHLSQISDLGDDTVIAISMGCPQLRKLTLIDCGGLTAVAFKFFHLLTNLEKLEIDSCWSLGEEAAHYISLLPAIHYMHLHTNRCGSGDIGKCFRFPPVPRDCEGLTINPWRLCG
ncbi:F-box/LRR-repeat protein 7-like isoform X2 [Schistocerca gregaria]|nr:F-box/LRR-repeat protein 7-like isoform X2 [Schistocerca gregaria]